MEQENVKSLSNSQKKNKLKVQIKLLRLIHL